MKIVWRNPNPINPRSFATVKRLAIEQPDPLRVFYLSSRDLEELGTVFELLVNRNVVSRAALSKCQPTRFVLKSPPTAPALLGGVSSF